MLASGTKLGPYEIQSLLGAGGMGEVYRARDLKLNRDVAIKMLPDDLARDRGRLSRLEREAQILATLNHPCIAHIYGLEDKSGVPALVLELVEGPTLADRIARGPLSLREALEIARQLADALEAAHDRNVIHRDLKPANIKIASDGTVKVLDFGLAKAIESEAAAGDLSLVTVEATTAGVVLGTAAYMSPEQARGQVVDKRTDIWAFGCVLFELLAGRRTFAGDTATDTLANILIREPNWSLLPSDVPVSAVALLRRCLEKDLKRRLRDIGDARLTIEDVIANRDPTPSTARRSPVPWLVAAGVAGLIVGGLGVRALTSRPTSTAAAPSRVVRFAIPLPPDAVINPTQNFQEAISPDGRVLAYAALRDGQRALYVRRLDELEPKVIDGLGAVTGPFFSPDGQWIGFVRSPGGLMKVALSGGAPISIAKQSGIQGATWGEDGTIVFTNLSLWSVSASGGEVTEVLKPDTAHGERWFRAPRFLPGGQVVLLTVSSEDTPSFDDARIVAFNLATREKKTLIEGGMSARYASTGHLVYARDGTLLAVPFDLDGLRVTGPPSPVAAGVFMSVNSGFAEFDIARDGTMIYSAGEVEGGERVPVWVDRQGRATALPLPPRSYLHPRLSRGDRQLAIEIEGATHDLHVYDFARGILTRLTADGLSHWPLWTPGGDRITFRSYRTNTFTMWSMPPDRSRPAEHVATTPGPSQSAGSWSPDGSALAFTQTNPDTGTDVYVARMDGDRTAVPLANSRFAEGSPKFSPDGKWIAYSSNESGRPEIFAQPWPGPGPKIQISSDGGTDPVWSKQSGELFYRNGDKMMAAAVRSGSTLTVAKPAMLWEGHYAAGMSSSCGVPGPTSSNYDVAADGTRFLMIRDRDQDLIGRQLNVVVNATSGLGR